MQWGDPLVVSGPMCYDAVTYTNPVCPKQHLDDLTAGRLCVSGTFCLCDGVSASWKVTCSKVQRREAILGADIRVWERAWGGREGGKDSHNVSLYNNAMNWV